MRLFDAPGSGLRPAAALLVVSIILAGCGGTITAPSTKQSQRGMPQEIGGVVEEKEFKELDAVLPAYPDDSRLLQFQTRRNTPYRFYIDPDSISIGSDRVIRYSAVAKSPSDATTTSYEGMRCKTSEYKVYAFGIDKGQWGKVPDVQWRQIPRFSGDFRFALYKDYFCDIEAIAGRNAKDLIYNLKGSPLNNGTDYNR
jgi:hypothetical protein